MSTELIAGLIVRFLVAAIFSSIIYVDAKKKKKDYIFWTIIVFLGFLFGGILGILVIIVYLWHRKTKPKSIEEVVKEWRKIVDGREPDEITSWTLRKTLYEMLQVWEFGKSIRMNPLWWLIWFINKIFNPDVRKKILLSEYIDDIRKELDRRMKKGKARVYHCIKKNLTEDVAKEESSLPKNFLQFLIFVFNKNKVVYSLFFIFVLMIWLVLLSFASSYGSGSLYENIIISIGAVLTFIGIPFFISHFIMYVMAKPAIKLMEKSIEISGSIGEEEVAEHLSKLDERYLVINDFKISEKRDIDHIVIGPTGIYVIETKNLKGKVIYKNGFKYIKKEEFEGKATDPVKQAKAHASLLRRYLENAVKEKGLKIRIPFIKPIAVFTHETDVEIYDNIDVPILRPEEVPKYISSQKEVLNKDIQKVIENFLIDDK